MAPNSKRPTVPEVRPLVVALYARNPAGCCWHIVLDDCNADNMSVAWCAERVSEDHADCMALVGPLTAMSKTQRKKLSRSA